MANKAEHTPGPCHLLPSYQDYEHKTIQVHGRTIAVVLTEDAVEHSAEDEGNARLLSAAYNAFDSAAEKLGLNAVEFAECMQEGGRAELLHAFEDIR